MLFLQALYPIYILCNPITNDDTGNKSIKDKCLCSDCTIKMNSFGLNTKCQSVNASHHANHQKDYHSPSKSNSPVKKVQLTIPNKNKLKGIQNHFKTKKMLPKLRNIKKKTEKMSREDEKINIDINDLKDDINEFEDIVKLLNQKVNDMRDSIHSIQHIMNQRR